MKVSLKFAQAQSNVDLVPNGVEELVKKIGAQLGAVDEVIDYGSRYQGIVVAKIVSCEKHPNADKLHVCLIDDSGAVKDVARDSRGLVEVVCGAPNVAEGQTVAWIPPGATVPSTFDKDPFRLEAKELRGVISNGMIASASELAISDDHSGIVVIDPKDVGEELTRPGTEFKKLYGLDDTVIDIENKMFTHRPDCFGVLGIAREIAGIQGLKFESPDWYQLEQAVKEVSAELNITVENKLPDTVPRFVVVPIEDVEVKQSPLWLQAGLNRVGIRPINNIVDVTNYVMYLTGQPLHAYDYDKLAKRADGKEPRIIIRSPEKDENLTLINGKTINLETENTILIADDAGPIGLGGVMGGYDTEVDNNTKNIVLECANFDMFTIRRMSMNYGIFSEAVTRFNKGQSSLQNIATINYAIEQIQMVSGGIQAGSIVDAHQELTKNPLIEVTADFINARLGTSLHSDQIKSLLENVEFAVEGDNALKIVAPFWRTDIHIREDVVEEVGRLYGFDHLPLTLPRRSITPTMLDPALSLKAKIRNKLASFGANEVLTYSFVHSDYFKKASQDEKLAYKLSNALSPDLQYYRLSLTPSLLANIHPNIKVGYDQFALFELGKVHSNSEKDEQGLPREFGRLSLVYADSRKGANTHAYYQAKEYLRQTTKVQYRLFDEKLLNGHALLTQMVKPYDASRSAMLWDGEKVVGIVGEFSTQTQKAFKLPEQSAGFEIFLSTLATNDTSAYVPLSKFPSTNADITFEVSQDINYGQLSEAFDSALISLLDTDQYVSWQPLDIFSSDKLNGKKRITFRVALTSYSHTLTDSTVSSVLDKVSDHLKVIGAERA